jgi:Spy/CpxP family protein refolding chaperone
MRTTLPIGLVFLATVPAFAQQPPPAPPKPGTFEKRIFIRQGPGDMGKWWKDSDVASKLQLGDNQLSQLDQIFYEHRIKLIDYTAEMEKEDLKLQTLLDADVPNDGQVQSQVDQVLTARGKVEREYTLMNLDLRKVLSLDQWHQLKAIREKRGFGGDRIFFRGNVGTGPHSKLGPGAPPDIFTAPLPPEAGVDSLPEPLD